MTVVSNKKQVHVKKDLNPKDGVGCENIIAKQFEFNHPHDIQPNATKKRPHISAFFHEIELFYDFDFHREEIIIKLKINIWIHYNEIL